MTSCNICKLRHCNGCNFDPNTKRVERKLEVLPKDCYSEYWKDVLLGIRQHEESCSWDYTFSFKDLDNRIYIVNNDENYFVLSRYKSNGISSSFEDFRPVFKVSTEIYDFRMYICKKPIFVEEICRLGFSKICEILSKFFLECIDKELGDNQEVFPVKEFKNQVETKYNIYNDSIIFTMSTYVGVKRDET